MDMQRLHTLHRDPGQRGRLSVPACSICLRVLHRSEWIESGELVRRLRGSEIDSVPRLRPALCHRCSDSIRARRERAGERLAA
jgi:hypothetical protein